MMETQNISCEKLGVDQLSVMGLAELKSNQSMRSSSCDNMKERGVMSVAELRCTEFASKKEHYCESGGGQREGTSLECTVCTVVRSGEC